MTRMRPAKRGCFEHRHGFFSLAIDILSWALGIRASSSHAKRGKRGSQTTERRIYLVIERLSLSLSLSLSLGSPPLIIYRVTAKSSLHILAESQRYLWRWEPDLPWPLYSHLLLRSSPPRTSRSWPRRGSPPLSAWQAFLGWPLHSENDFTHVLVQWSGWSKLMVKFGYLMVKLHKGFPRPFHWCIALAVEVAASSSKYVRSGRKFKIKVWFYWLLASFRNTTDRSGHQKPDRPIE